MGYRYGIWLVYDQKLYNTKHLGHVTLTCFMEKKEAQSLYDELIKKYNKIFLKTDGIPVLFPSQFYPRDQNKICSWGYNYSCNEWNNLKNICNKYDADFSHTPHTSIEYGFDSNLFIPKITDNKKIECDIYFVDIRSDFPNDWKIIESEYL